MDLLQVQQTTFSVHEDNLSIMPRMKMFFVVDAAIFCYKDCDLEKVRVFVEVKC